MIAYVSVVWSNVPVLKLSIASSYDDMSRHVPACTDHHFHTAIVIYKLFGAGISLDWSNMRSRDIKKKPSCGR